MFDAVRALDKMDILCNAEQDAMATCLINSGSKNTEACGDCFVKLNSIHYIQHNVKDCRLSNADGQDIQITI